MSGETGILSLGGVAIPDEARLTWAQTRQTIRSEVQLEYSDLSCEIQQGPVTTAKRLVTLSCSGWAPPGLDALARTSTHTLQYEALTASSTWATQTMTCWIWEPLKYSDDVRAPGGGSSSWTITLREA